MSLAEKILIGTLLLGVGTLGYAVIETIKQGSKVEAFQKVYSEALFKYGDLNYDRVISKEEQERFDLKVLDGKNVYFTDGWPRYQNGDRVPEEVVTKWVEEYVRKQN